MTETITRTTTQRSWPHLNAWCERGPLAYIDLIITETLVPDASEAVAALVCHLSAATRMGSLAITINDATVTPTPAIWWRGDEKHDDDDATIATATALICQGASELVEPTPHIHCAAGRYAFQRYHRKEVSIQQRCVALAATTPTPVSPPPPIDGLEPEQMAAITHSCRHALSLICGGPGTGKTFTAGHLIRVLVAALPTAPRVILTAPTGKAAANLQAALPDIAIAPACTLHSLLGIGSNQAPTMIDADIVVVDECSMLDVDLFDALLFAIPDRCRLILLGDPHQLPPVGVGTPFTTLAAESNHVTTLRRCRRQESDDIITFAEAIKMGDSDAVVAQLNAGTAVNGVKRVAFTTKEELLSAVALHYPPSLDTLNEEELLALFSTFRILSPLRKGVWGVDTLNHYLHGQLRQCYRGNLIAPIIITANDQQRHLFNGDIGLLVTASATPSRGDYALFLGRSGAMERIPALLLPRYDYSYCLSVHKSQGSEFDHVMLLLPDGSETFGREVLYTGATRAKRLLEVWGSNAVVAATVTS